MRLSDLTGEELFTRNAIRPDRRVRTAELPTFIDRVLDGPARRPGTGRGWLDRGGVVAIVAAAVAIACVLLGAWAALG